MLELLYIRKLEARERWANLTLTLGETPKDKTWSKSYFIVKKIERCKEWVHKGMVFVSFFYDCHKRVFCQQWKAKGFFFFCWVYDMVFYGMVWKAYGKQDVQQGASYCYDLLLAPDLTTQMVHSTLPTPSYLVWRFYQQLGYQKKGMIYKQHTKKPNGPWQNIKPWKLS
jgi:hypothetical protein